MPGLFHLYPFKVGEILKLKKPHPCGGQRWQVSRVGADIAIKCLTCGHLQTMPRRQLEKAIKAVEPPDQAI
jgi:hypothetical protein